MGLLAARGNAFEALEPADRVFDARTGLVEAFRKEAPSPLEFS